MYLPWLGYFDRIAKSDIHIILDHAQFEKNSMINRNKIRVDNSWKWLTVPVKTKNRFGELDIKKLEIDNTSSWRQKHWKTIQLNYSKTKYFQHHASFFEGVYKKEWLKLFLMIEYINNYIIKELKINTKIIRSSDLEPKLNKSELILELCQKVDAKKYISGPFGRDYLNLTDFDNSGIVVDFHDYVHPIYSQAYDGFVSNMSIVDILFNHGNDSLDILKT